METRETYETTPLQQAKARWADAQRYYDASESHESIAGRTHNRERSERAKQDAATLAAIAQAEALSRPLPPKYTSDNGIDGTYDVRWAQ